MAGAAGFGAVAILACFSSASSGFAGLGMAVALRQAGEAADDPSVSLGLVEEINSTVEEVERDIELLRTFDQDVQVTPEQVSRRTALCSESRKETLKLHNCG